MRGIRRTVYIHLQRREIEDKEEVQEGNNKGSEAGERGKSMCTKWKLRIMNEVERRESRITDTPDAIDLLNEICLLYRVEKMIDMVWMIEKIDLEVGERALIMENQQRQGEVLVEIRV